MIDWTKGKNGKKMIIELKPMDIVYYEKDLGRYPL